MRTALYTLCICALLMVALLLHRPYPGSIAVTREPDGRTIALYWADTGALIAEYEPGDKAYKELDLALRGRLDGRGNK